jgi:hypothetical protein
MHKKNLKVIFKCMRDKDLKKNTQPSLKDVPEGKLVINSGKVINIKNPAMNRRGKDS